MVQILDFSCRLSLFVTSHKFVVLHKRVSVYVGWGGKLFDQQKLKGLPLQAKGRISSSKWSDHEQERVGF